MGQRDYILKRYPFSDILEEHAEVAAILWEQRALAARRPNHDALSLKKLERRIDTHLEGLRQEPELSRFFVTEALSNYGSDGEAFVAAIYALESGNAGLVYSVLEHIADTGTCAKGFISALAWVPSEVSLPWIEAFLKSDKTLEKAIALAACGASRINPGHYLRTILHSSAEANDEALLARALRLAGELRRQDLANPVQDISSQMRSQPLAHQWAGWSAVMLGLPLDLEQMIHSVSVNDHCPDLILETLFRFSPLEPARKCIKELVTNNHTRTAIKACAALGDPGCLDWIIGRAHHPASARIAAYAFYTITGLTVPETKEPSDWVDLIEASDDEFFLECDDYDSALQWPKVDELTETWSQNRSMYKSGQRYFLGSAMKPSFLQRVYGSGNQHHRLAAAIELAQLYPRSVFLNSSSK